MPANLRSIKSARIFPLPEWYLPKGTTNASDQRLEEASSSCERWGIGFAGIVVVAVIAELIIAWIQPPYLLFLTESAFSDAVIAIGIAGEVLLGTIWNNHIQTELRRRSNERLGSAVQSAGEATARAEEARLEIARLSTPRVRLLTPEACEAIVAKMLPFRGTRRSRTVGFLLGVRAAHSTSPLAIFGLESWPATTSRALASGSVRQGKLDDAAPFIWRCECLQHLNRTKSRK